MNAGPATGCAAKEIRCFAHNLEWGQDLFYLKDWHDEHPEARPLHLALDGPRSLDLFHQAQTTWTPTAPEDAGDSGWNWIPTTGCCRWARAMNRLRSPNHGQDARATRQNSCVGPQGGGQGDRTGLPAAGCVISQHNVLSWTGTARGPGAANDLARLL
jgi:hypothetical protein